MPLQAPSPAVVADVPTGQARYAHLAAQWREAITSGAWAPGSPVASEQRLAQLHGVALGTVRQALALLAADGLVERRHGHGTFVAGAMGGAPMLRFFRFGESATAQVPQSRVLQRRPMQATAPVARALGVPPKSPVLRLDRLRLVAGIPRLVERIWLRLPACAALLEHPSAQWGDLLYPALARLCNVHVHRAVDHIRFDAFTQADGQHLGLPAGHPCALVQRSAFDLSGQPVEWRHTRGDGRDFHYTVDIR
jgi:GntR family transcriptional regulator